MKRSARSIAAVVAMLTLAGCLPAPPRHLAVFTGGSQQVQDFATWLGRTPTVVNSYLGDDGWDDPTPYLHPWQGSPWTMSFGVPMLPRGGTLADGAAGAYDARYQELAQKLIAEGLDDAILRIGFEFNGNWFRWRAAADPTLWKAYWKRIVLVMRAVPGANFKFDWTLLEGLYEIPAPSVYPGDDYVDYIGVNLFDGSPEYPISPNASPSEAHAIRERAWARKLTETYGLNYWLLFAASHGKYLSLPEWALISNLGGGGDNVVFIERMHEWVTHVNIVYQSYFNADATLGDSRLWPTTHFPNAAARYRELFG